MSDPHAPPAVGAEAPGVSTPATAAPERAAGPLVSLLLTVGALFTFMLMQTAVMLAAVAVKVWSEGGSSADPFDLLFANMGWSFSLATLLTAPPAVALAAGGLYLVARGRVEAPRAAVWQHLGLGRPRWNALVFWSFATVAYAYLYDVVGDLFDRPPLPQFMIDFHASAGTAWLLGAAVVIAAPLVEEVLFRGVLLTGFTETRRRRFWGLLLSAAMWAAIHGQYDLYDMTGIFLLGLLFGAARLQGRSLWAPFLLHAGFNLYAMVQLLDALGPIA